MNDIDFTRIVIIFAVLLFSLSFHEAAHAWTASQLGDPTARRLGRVSLNPAVHVDPIGTVLFPLIAMFSNVPVIGWAKPVPVDFRHFQAPRRDFMIVAAAGPVSNLVLAVAASMAWHLVPGASAGGLVSSLLQVAIYLNVLLAVFNMIPVPPLDGGNVMAGLLPPAAAVIFDRMRPWGFLILYLMMFSGVLSALIVPPMTLVLSWLT